MVTPFEIIALSPAVSVILLFRFGGEDAGAKPSDLFGGGEPSGASRRERRAASDLKLLTALGLAVALGGCNPAGYPTCFRVECPYPPVYHASYAGYIPAYAPGAVAFGEPPYDDPFYDYTVRSDTISPSTGNAQAANLALQTATPWPRYSTNTAIPGNGARMVNTIHNYESGPTPAVSGAGGGGGAGGVSGGH